jgi:hypothetical protein
MFNSKALKPRKFRWNLESDYEDGNMSFPEKISYLFKKFLVWPFTDNYKYYKRKFKIARDYAVFGWDNYDWDFHCVYQLMEFKLKRLYRALENGVAYQEKEDMDALKEMIKIVRRLGRKTYENKYHRLHNGKWGEIQTSSTPNYDDDGKVRTYTWHSWRNSTEHASQEIKDQERKEFLECYEKGEADRIKDVRRLAELLEKHSLNLWD